MRPTTARLSLLCAAAVLATSASASAQVPAITPAPTVAAVTRAVDTCLKATSRAGVDDRLFLADGWTTYAIDGPPGDRFYAKGILRASLGTRPGVGGSCFVFFNTRRPYKLPALTAALEKSMGMKAAAKSPAFALIPVADKILTARVEPTPTGWLVNVAVEM